MKTKILILSIVLIGLGIGGFLIYQKQKIEPAAQEQFSQTEMPPGVSSSTQTDERKTNSEKCPDGIWDEAEQKDPALCPEDKPSGIESPQQQNQSTTEKSEEW